MQADSISSFGILLKKPVIIKIVTGNENVRYGSTSPTRLLDSPIFAKLVKSGIMTQCTGIIMPIIKKVMHGHASLQRSLPIANAAMEPMSILRTNVTPHTIKELSVAIPSFPAVHAKIKLSR